MQLPELDGYLRSKKLHIFVIVNLVFWVGFLIMFVLAWYEEAMHTIFA